MTERPRVLHIITSLAVGGAQGHLLRLIAGLSEQYECDLVYFKQDDLLPDFEPVARNITRIGLGSLGNPVSFWSLLLHMRRGRYVVVHTHLLKADFWGSLAGRLSGIPVISSKHNAEEVLRNRLISVVHGLVSLLNHRIIALSSAVAEYMRNIGRIRDARLVVIRYGIDPAPSEIADISNVRQELGIDPDVPLALCAARLDPQKDHATLIKAWSRVHPIYPQARLLLAGGSQKGGESYVRNLHALTRDLGLGECVRFLGVRRDVSNLLVAADLLVMSSLWEGLGLVFLEAMNASCPIVATAVGGVPEVVRDGETGFLVASGDYDAFGDAVIRLIEQPDLARKLGQNGRNRLERDFTAKEMIRSMLSLYKQITGTIERPIVPQPPDTR